MSGFKVPGTLTVSNTALAAVAGLVEEVNAKEFSATRKAATDSQAFVYFVECEIDINKEINHQASGDGGADDSWGLNAIRLEKGSFSGKNTIKLPSAAGIPVPAGLITANDTDGEKISDFLVTLTLSASDQGALSAAASISGADAVSGATAENLLNAQVVKFMKPSASEPTVDSADDDVLTATLGASELAADYAGELEALETQYTIADIVANWAIKVSAIPLTVDSIMSQHARLGGKTSSAVFSPGEKMVCASAGTYGIAVDDYEGNSVQIVEAANVFAVLTQSA